MSTQRIWPALVQTSCIDSACTMGEIQPASNASQTMATQRRARAAGERITRPNCRDTAGVLISTHYPVSGAWQQASVGRQQHLVFQDAE